MLRKYFIILISVITFTGCPGRKKIPENLFEKYGWILTCPDPTVTYTDLMDGTVMREKNGSAPYCVYLQSSYRIKKCLQGQVYRQAQNDCHGTGTAPDWGAQKFQFCLTNDGSCDMDRTKSPAATSCTNDTTAGQFWGLAVSGEPGPVDPEGIVHFPDIPVGSTNLIWAYSSTPDNPTGSVYYLDAVQGSVYGTAQLKNTYQYVLCITPHVW